MTLTTTLAYYGGPLLLVYLAKRVIWDGSRRNKHLPPGPPGVPLLGNLFDFPSEKNWLTWKHYAEKYGP
jgi:hypothetical protein